MSCLQRKGLYPPPTGESDILGLEAVGIVDRLGPGCVKSWKPGDKVMALLPGKDVFKKKNLQKMSKSVITSNLIKKIFRKC